MRAWTIDARIAELIPELESQHKVRLRMVPWSDEGPQGRVREIEISRPVQEASGIMRYPPIGQVFVRGPADGRESVIETARPGHEALVGKIKEKIAAVLG
jgi:hypothetical protein